MKKRDGVPPDDAGPPSPLRSPLVRWWNQVPLPIRTAIRWGWKNRTVRWIVGILLVIFFGGIIAQLLGLTNTLLRPLVAGVEVVIRSPVGRFVVLNLALIGSTLFVYAKFRARANHLLAARAVDRYLTGLKHMVHKRFALARRDLTVVGETGRVVDLHTAVAGFPELQEDALLKLAFCHAELGQISEGMRCLESVPRASLPPRQARTFDEVHALLYDASDDFLPETKVAELQKALQADAKNVRLLRALVARQVEIEAFAEAAGTQKRLISVLGKAARDQERRHLAYLHYRNAEQLLVDGAGAPGPEHLASLGPEQRKKVVAELNRSIKVYPALSLAYLLLGGLHQGAGNRALAIETWGRHPSPPALEQVRHLLDETAQNAGELYREVVAAFPTVGALLAIADHAHRADDSEFAAKILEHLSASGITTPAQELLHGDVLLAGGRRDDALARYQAGVEAFLHRGDDSSRVPAPPR